jgi:hypothetical protein
VLIGVPSETFQYSEVWDKETELQTLWDFRFWQQQVWRWLSSGLSHCVVYHVSEVLAASVISLGSQWTSAGLCSTASQKTAIFML